LDSFGIDENMYCITPEENAIAVKRSVLSLSFGIDHDSVYPHTVCRVGSLEIEMA
jgi:hypothetical protein